jgi:hypothetical protein
MRRYDSKIRMRALAHIILSSNKYGTNWYPCGEEVKPSRVAKRQAVRCTCRKEKNDYQREYAQSIQFENETEAQSL